MNSILIVDDEYAVLRSLERLLIRDYNVTKFTDPTLAIEHFKHNEVDLIISDIRMPIISGFELVGEFGSYHPFAGKILITGYADIQQCQTVLDNNVVDIILSKPWNNIELKSIVNTVCELVRLRKNPT
jgi:two-component system, probable response regulator PhcQ